MRSVRSPEPRFAHIAAAISDPTRARMLSVLLSGQSRSAAELARAADVTPQAASTQLSHLVATGLLSVRTQGRYKYFTLADADVGHALEALALLAERDTVSDRWLKPPYAPLKYARRCYGHLAGELGVALFHALRSSELLTPNSAGVLELTHAGRAWLTRIGVTPSPPVHTDKRFAYPCMDWSERQDHLAGELAKQLLRHFVEKGWVRLSETSRALVVTPSGRSVFQDLCIPV